MKQQRFEHDRLVRARRARLPRRLRERPAARSRRPSGGAATTPGRRPAARGSRRPRATRRPGGTRDAARSFAIRTVGVARTCSRPSPGRSSMARMNGRTKSSKVTSALTGLPGRPMTVAPSQLADRERLARLHRDPPEVEAPVALEHGAHVVVPADAHAARGHDEVGLPRRLHQRILDPLLLVQLARQDERLAAGLDDRGRQRDAVRVVDLARAERLPGPTSSLPVERIATTGRRRTDTSPMPSDASTAILAGVSAPGRQISSPARVSCAAARTWLARGTLPRDRDESVGLVRLLDRHDRVGTGRQRRAGHDAGRRARPRRVGSSAAPAATSPTHPQAAGRVRRANGEAVHGGVGERRHVDGRDHLRLGQHAPERIAPGARPRVSARCARARRRRYASSSVSIGRPRGPASCAPR